MKGLILSGGKGTRLRPLTYACAKQLLPVANKPILYYILEGMSQAGVREIGLVVGDTRREIMAAIGDGQRFGVKVTYIHQEEPLGLAHAVLVARPFLGDDPFMLYLGDNLLQEDLSQIIQRFYREDCQALVVVTPVANPRLFGVAEVENSRVIRVVEKPARPVSNLALIGVYLFQPQIFSAINRITPSWRNELEITDAIQVLVEDQAQVTAHTLQGWWKDTGLVDDLLDANRYLLDRLAGQMGGQSDAASMIQGKVAVGGGTRIRNSVICGPVIIGEGCEVVNSYVGPYTSIGNKSRLLGVEVQQSIVMEGAVLREAGRLADSVIGRCAVIARGPGRPKAHRLLVTDHSRLLLDD